MTLSISYQVLQCIRRGTKWRSIDLVPGAEYNCNVNLGKAPEYSPWDRSTDNYSVLLLQAFEEYPEELGETDGSRSNNS